MSSLFSLSESESTSVSLSEYENEDIVSSESVSCGVGGVVGGSVGALGGVEP